MFVVIGLVAYAAMLATPLSPPVLFTGAALLAVLLAAQLLLGVAQGPIFPVTTGVLEAWFRPARWPLVQGAAAHGPAAWRHTGAAAHRAAHERIRMATGAVVDHLAGACRDRVVGLVRPQYPGGAPPCSAEELAELGPTCAGGAPQAMSWARVWALLRNRDVLLLTVSYLFMNYVYYLLSTWVLLLPGAGAAFHGARERLPGRGTAARGRGRCRYRGLRRQHLSTRLGVRRGLRIIPLLSLPAAGLLQFLAVDAVNAYLAVVALALCYACVELNEGPYWAAIMHVARTDTMAASGLSTPAATSAASSGSRSSATWPNTRPGPVLSCSGRCSPWSAPPRGCSWTRPA